MFQGGREGGRVTCVGMHLFYHSQGHVIMNTQPQSVYQRVIDKTKGLAFQSQFIAQNIDKKRAALASGVGSVVNSVKIVTTTYCFFFSTGSPVTVWEQVGCCSSCMKLCLCVDSI